MSDTADRNSQGSYILAIALAGVAFMVVLWYAAPAVLVSCIRNEQVEWEGQHFGLVPLLKGPLPVLISWRGRDCVPHLKRALNDDSRFIAAHVYLTYISPGAHPMSAAHFNGFYVDLYTDRIVIPPNQKQAIITQWNPK